MITGPGYTRGSDETSVNSDTGTSGTPNFPNNRRSSFADQEWQMNYIINRKDGL